DDKGTIPRNVKGSIDTSHFVGGRGQGKEVIVPVPGSTQKSTRAAGCGDTSKAGAVLDTNHAMGALGGIVGVDTRLRGWLGEEPSGKQYAVDVRVRAVIRSVANVEPVTDNLRGRTVGHCSYPVAGQS